MPVENEIKLRIDDVEAARQRIVALGFTVLHERTYENNVVCDTADLALRRTRHLLRVRTAGGRTTITMKGPSEEGRHKTREEIEYTASGPEPVLAIFARLGFHPVFRYEKYRTEYAKPDGPGVITVDETPIGAFVELEGPAEWVDMTAHELHFSPADYIKESYGALYVEYSRRNGTASTEMIFPK